MLAVCVGASWELWLSVHSLTSNLTHSYLHVAIWTMCGNRDHVKDKVQYWAQYLLLLWKQYLVRLGSAYHAGDLVLIADGKQEFIRKLNQLEIMMVIVNKTTEVVREKY